MKNQVWKCLFLAAAVSFSAAGFVWAQEETEAVTEESSEAGTEALLETEDASEGDGTEALTEGEAKGEGLSENLFDFQIQIEDAVYQFPMSYEEFLSYGWELDANHSDAEMELSHNQYDLVYFKKGGLECMTYVINLGMNSQKVSECLVGGMEISNFDWEVQPGQIYLAAGIERGVSTQEEIEAAYGTPTSVYNGDMYTSLTYEKDSYCEVELYVYKESGVLEDIDMRNFVAPEGFDAGSASEEVPEEIASYEAPAQLGDDLFSYNVEFDGTLYQLPCPVSVLVENGWEIDRNNTEESIAAKSSGWVAFQKGGLTFDVLARNSADYATIPENCWVEELGAGGYGMETSMKIPGGIEIGTTEEDLKAALEAAGFSLEPDEGNPNAVIIEEGSTYRQYRVEKDWANGISFLIYTDESGDLYPINTVYKIEISHEKE